MPKCSQLRLCLQIGSGMLFTLLERCFASAGLTQKPQMSYISLTFQVLLERMPDLGLASP